MTLSLRKELQRMKENIEFNSGKNLKLTRMEKLRKTMVRLKSAQFLKPFLFLNLILNIGLEWAGFPALAFYMHTILKQMKIPLDEYWVAVGLSGYRSILTVGLSFVLYKVRRRPVYLMAGSLVCLATASLSAYSWVLPYLEQVRQFAVL